MKYNILIIGNGAREHALAHHFSFDNSVKHIYIITGNDGCLLVPRVSIVNLVNISDILQFAISHHIYLTIVGSETLLMEGIVDVFQGAGKKIFGPHKEAAKLEGSKVFSKQFMQKYNINTAKYKVFDEYHSAIQYIAHQKFPLVIKVNGLALGKGVVIAHTQADANNAVYDIFLNKKFGHAGKMVVIEEYIFGTEASVIAITDGERIVPLIAVKDHKKIGNNETGENTGGMGAVAPHKTFSITDERFVKDILIPTNIGILAENIQFCGIIFFGIMFNDNGVYLLEYNLRMGDPETQAMLPLLRTQLFELIDNALNGKIIPVDWYAVHSCAVVLASKGYPDKYETNKLITGIENGLSSGVVSKDGEYYTSGGRVMTVVRTGADGPQASINAYNAVNDVHFEDMYYRTDIV